MVGGGCAHKDSKTDRKPIHGLHPSSLLERSDVDPNIPDTIYGQTPLLWAVENGHEGVVRKLLERNDVDPNIAGNRFGRTPLSRAAGSGHEAIVRMLLKRSDTNPNIPNTPYGRTPLELALWGGYERIAKLLRVRMLSPGLSELSEPLFKRARRS